MSLYIDSQKDLIHALNRALYQHDPANTYCSLNEGMEDEYISEACEIARDFEKGSTLQQAMNRVMQVNFNGQYEQRKLMAAYNDVRSNMI